MDGNLPTREPQMRQMAEAALARPGNVAAWPVKLREAWDANRDRKATAELPFLARMGLVVTLAASAVDLLVVHEVAGWALLFRLLTIAPLTAIALMLLRNGRLRAAKAIITATMALYAASTIWVSSFATSDVIARFSMAVVVLMVIGLQTLPFSMTEKVRFALVFSLATFVAGIFPHPLPPILLLQHMIFCAIAMAGGLVLARRIWDFEARDFLRGLQQQFDREQLEQSNALLRELSESDPLTGLPNRRTFERAFDECRAKAGMGTMAVMMIDLDRFKDFNDRYGHQAGDRCLMEVARALDRCIQPHGGHVARFGGEEFVALLPETDTCYCVTVAEEMRQTLAGLAIAVGPKAEAGITASIGIARSRGERSMGELLARADEALYRAKHNGRNRVELAYAAVEELG